MNEEQKARIAEMAKEQSPVAEVSKANPANEREVRVTEATRVPMSVPQQKLAVPDIPGFHLHWFRGGNIARAQRAGYTFVEEGEVEITNTRLADDAGTNGSSDMGTRYSIEAGGGLDSGGQPERLYLMKLREEWWEQDQAKIAESNDKLAAALRGGNAPGAMTDADAIRHAHVPDWAPQRNSKANNLFVKKTRR
jgi:hypothetical protein